MYLPLLQAVVEPIVVQNVPAQQGPWQWVLSYLPLIGWSTVIAGIWMASRFLTKVEIRAKVFEENNNTLIASNTELKTTLEGQVNAQRELAQSVHQLAEAMHHQSELHSEQLSLIREMSSDQKLLAQNQTTIMNGFQRVVERLIDVVKDNKDQD